MRHIDPHVHCRDGKQSYKANIREVSEIAKAQGVLAIFDMPNTEPPILSEKEVKQRIKLAEQRKPKVKYFLYVGLTSDENQIKQAAKLVENYAQVVGLKLFTTEVKRETDQEKIYQILANLDYQGVLAVHCEKESEFKPELWDSQKPWTHSLARPAQAEIESIKDQIRHFKMSHFQGKLDICHISCPESVDLVQQAKKSLNINCGITPHHILFTEDLLRGKHGLLYKVNPPLRDEVRVKRLREQLLQGKIDWIETDHAPHTQAEKFNPPYLSGIPSLLLYKKLINWLQIQGMTEKEIENLTYWNIKKTFGDKLNSV